MARTHRIRRKDLRRPDEFVTTSRRVAAWAVDNRTTVIIVTGAVIVLLVALLAYRTARSSREASAGEAYRQARALLEERKYTEAATAFRQAAETYPSTGTGVLAQLQSANSLLLADRPGEAALAYRKFLDSGPPTDDLRQLALTRLGYAHEQAAKPAEAQAAYAAAAALTGPFSAEALLGEARVADHAGDQARARELYARFLEQHPTSGRRRLAIARLTALGGSVPPANGAPGPGSPVEVVAQPVTD